MSVQAIKVIIDRGSPVPLYHQLAEQLTRAITDGTLQPGDPFENELAIADRLDLSRPTVRRAIGDMVNQGLLVRRRGIGTTVAQRVVHRRDELTSQYDDLIASGHRPSTTVLSLTVEQDADRAADLGQAADADLVHVRRLRSADGAPIGVMVNWLPPAFADLTTADVEAGSLYALLAERGVRFAVAKQRIGARQPTRAEAEVLGMSRTQPVLTVDRVAYDPDGQPTEVGRHVYRADRYDFEVTLHER